MIAHTHLSVSYAIDAIPAEMFRRVERSLAVVNISICLAGIAVINLLAASELRSVLTGAVLVLTGIALTGLYKLTRALVGIGLLITKMWARSRAVKLGIDPDDFEKTWNDAIGSTDKKA